MSGSFHARFVRTTIWIGLAGSALILPVAPACWASAFVSGAYYKLGDDDPGAIPGQAGNAITRDSFGDSLDLNRLDTPRYSSDVPAQGPAGDTISMVFANEGLGGPAFPGAYGRVTPLNSVPQGLALEAWVKIGPSGLDGPAAAARSMLIAYNGDPAANGFGLFVSDDDYVARIGTFERLLGPAEVGVWHHLAYVMNFNTASYYYDGSLVATSDKDPLPTAPSAGFWVGGYGGGPATNVPEVGFNGWIDEVRYQSFNPLAAGAFNPTAFLITPVPEPAAAGALAIAAVVGGLLRRPRSRR